VQRTVASDGFAFESEKGCLVFYKYRSNLHLDNTSSPSEGALAKHCCFLPLSCDWFHFLAKPTPSLVCSSSRTSCSQTLKWILGRTTMSPHEQQVAMSQSPYATLEDIREEGKVSASYRCTAVTFSSERLNSLFPNTMAAVFSMCELQFLPALT
jgi:hypothetical protein